MHSILIEVRTQYSLIAEAMCRCHTVLFVATVFLIYLVLPNYFRKNSFERSCFVNASKMAITFGVDYSSNISEKEIL